jgi:uncharacterized membrane protein
VSELSELSELAESPQKTRSARRLEIVYRAGLVLKAVDGGFELLAGLALWLFPAVLHHLIEPLARVAEGPHPFRNFVAYWFGRADHELLAGHHVFAIVFLLLHGVVKLVLVYCLLREFRAVYPWALGVLSLFAVYQVIVLVHTPTVGMAVLTAIDVVIIWLVWREWRALRSR